MPPRYANLRRPFIFVSFCPPMYQNFYVILIIEIINLYDLYDIDCLQYFKYLCEQSGSHTPDFHATFIPTFRNTMCEVQGQKISRE